jgi:ribosomal protein S18 acetylase RimI-like enzyme
VDDAERVREASSLFGAPTDDEAVRAHLASPTDHLFIAYLGSSPAGYARAHELRRLDGLRPKLMLYEIGTAPQFRRRGVGRALIEAAKALGRSRSASLMFAITGSRNTAAMRLYASTGGRRLALDDAILSYDLTDDD